MKFCRYAFVIPMVQREPLFWQDLAHCDYFSESQQFFNLISAWLLNIFNVALSGASEPSREQWHVKPHFIARPFCALVILKYISGLFSLSKQYSCAPKFNNLSNKVLVLFSTSFANLRIFLFNIPP